MRGRTRQFTGVKNVHGFHTSTTETYFCSTFWIIYLISWIVLADCVSRFQKPCTEVKSEVTCIEFNSNCCVRTAFIQKFFTVISCFGSNSHALYISGNTCRPNPDSLKCTCADKRGDASITGIPTPYSWTRSFLKMNVMTISIVKWQDCILVCFISGSSWIS